MRDATAGSLEKALVSAQQVCSCPMYSADGGTENEAEVVCGLKKALAVGGCGGDASSCKRARAVRMEEMAAFSLSPLEEVEVWEPSSDASGLTSTASENCGLLSWK